MEMDSADSADSNESSSKENSEPQRKDNSEAIANEHTSEVLESSSEVHTSTRFTPSIRYMIMYNFQQRVSNSFNCKFTGININ